MQPANQVVTDRYALYQGDCLEIMPTLPDQSVHLAVYSPPFGALLYQYSSDPRDLSNAKDYQEFFEHYAFVVKETARLLLPGRMAAVHAMDVPRPGLDTCIDMPGDIIRLHEQCGFRWVCRYHIWKEPLEVRNRTMAKVLHHKTLCEDSTRCSIAHADQLMIFRRKGTNPVPVVHPTGLTDYAGSRVAPPNVLSYRGYTGDQIENVYSQWVWRNYASAFWDDVRLNRVLPYRPAKDQDDESHVHPLQLDVIERAIVLWSNPDETVLTPFMGVGSEVYGAVFNGRRAVGVELKASYYRQAVRNIEAAMKDRKPTEPQNVLVME
jgi:DNA modification methylase